MTNDARELINSGMTELGLNYAFVRWDDEPSYPYFTGEYQEVPTMSEDGFDQSTFILVGVTRGSWAELEGAKEKIENYFNRIGGKTVSTDNGSVVAIFYDNSMVVPTGDMELKKIEIRLSVKEWKVNI